MDMREFAEKCESCNPYDDPGQATELLKAASELAQAILKKREKSTVPEDFNKFWKIYPKKVAKQDAVKAWKKLKPDEKLLAEILTALEKQKQSPQWRKDGGQFIPYPATWLNGRRWEDVQEQPVPAYEFDPDDPYAIWRDRDNG